MKTLLYRIWRYFKIRGLLKQRQFWDDRLHRLIDEHGAMSSSGYYAGVPSEQRPGMDVYARCELQEIAKIDKELTKLGHD